MRLRNDLLNILRVAASLSLLVASACSGHQAGTSLLPSLAKAPTQQTGGGNKQSSTTSGVTVTGTIAGSITGGFTMNAGKHCGYVHVYTSGATITGPTLAAGLYAQATGSGSCATSITASTVTLSTTPITSPAPSASPTPITSQTPAPLGSPIPMRPGSVTAKGPIMGLFSGGFTINGGPSYGYLHVYTNASTVFSGGAPAVGEYAISTGTGSLNTNVTATFVALSSTAPSSVTLTGTASSSTAYGFIANAGTSYPSVPVVVNSVTIVGGPSLVAGATIKVTGMGSLSNSVLASSIVVSTPSPPPGAQATPTPGPIAQKHVLTQDYLGAPYGTTSIAWSSAAPYLTWAQTGTASATAIAATGIKTQFYTDPNKTSPHAGDPLYSSDETEFAHDCNGNRVSDVFDNVTQYVMNIGGTSMQTAFANYVTYMSGRGHFDAAFEDDAGPPMQDTYVTYSSTPCGYSDSAWLTAGQTLNQASTLPIIFNGLNIFNGQSESESLALLQSSNTIGGSLEHCYSDSGQPKMGGWSWQVTENTELQVSAENKLFFCVLRNLNAASTQADSRIYALASFLLTYNPASSVLWEQYATGTGFHVLPESQLVVLNPAGGTPSNVSAMMQTGGAYGRQYGQCYLAGNFVGPCAVAVNITSSPEPNPFPQYSHTLVVSGGGILDGGTVATNGPAAPSSLGALEAEIVFP